MSNEVWTQIYDRLAHLIREHRTTLVFVNTRRMAERVCRHLSERLDADGAAGTARGLEAGGRGLEVRVAETADSTSGDADATSSKPQDEQPLREFRPPASSLQPPAGARGRRSSVAAHHGSLAKDLRFDAEQRLKRGELKALVATASLELGIDIGDVDLVCQLGSPRSINAFLQRVGRSGHAVGGTPKGRLFPLSRDELAECTALLDSGATRGARSPQDPAEADRCPVAAYRRRSGDARLHRERAFRALARRLSVS